MYVQTPTLYIILHAFMGVGRPLWGKERKSATLMFPAYQGKGS